MYDDIDLTDLDRFTAGFPHGVFDVLRRESPVWFHPPTASTPGGEGFWVLSRYADIVAVATDLATFSSETGGGRNGGGTTLEDMPLGFVVGALLNMMDESRHAKFRKLLTPSTTPRALRAMEDDLRRRAVGIVEAALAALPHDARKVIELRNVERKSFREIGSVLGCSPDAARKRWVRALAQMRTALTGHE